MQAHRVEPATYGSDNDVLALRGPCDPGHKVSGGSLVPEVNAEGGRQRVHHGDKGHHKGYCNVELHADLQGVWCSILVFGVLRGSQSQMHTAAR